MTMNNCPFEAEMSPDDLDQLPTAAESVTQSGLAGGSSPHLCGSGVAAARGQVTPAVCS